MQSLFLCINYKFAFNCQKKKKKRSILGGYRQCHWGTGIFQNDHYSAVGGVFSYPKSRRDVDRDMDRLCLGYQVLRGVSYMTWTGALFKGLVHGECKSDIERVGYCNTCMPIPACTDLHKTARLC